MKAALVVRIIKLCVGAGLLVGSMIRYVLAGSMKDMSTDELGSILLLAILGVYFMHSAFISDLEERLKKLEIKEAKSHE